MEFETRAIRVGEEPNFKEGGTGDVVVPIHLTTTYAREKVAIPTAGYEYSRTENPTRDALQERLASLENAKHGLAYSSGLAAQTNIVLSLLNSGDHVLAFDDLYGGTRRLFSQVFNRKFRIDVSYVDASDPQNVAKNIRDNTRLIWLETPTNPLLKISDIRAISEIARPKNIIVVVDNTFMTPYFQQPLSLGADIVLHSTTKYINGHSDSIGGALMLNNDEMHDALKFTQNAAGAVLSPFESYLILRGIKTLAVRMDRHNKNALAIAKHLESHRLVKRVIYPGLENYAQYDLAKQQMSGFGGMVSSELDGDLAAAERFVESLELFSLAESLGGVESLVELPAVMTHASVPAEQRKKIGIADSLIRISVGIENVKDLITDIDNSLKRI